MRTTSWRLAAVALLAVLALPARAEKPDAPVQESKDLCSYLKDVEAKPEAACAPDAILSLRARDPNAFAEKLTLAAKRKAEVQKAYERLKASSEKNGPDLPRLEPPINERTFPAWLGDKALDLKPVYARLLEAQNEQLEQQRAAETSPERRAEIERALASNQAKIASLEKIKDPSQLSCFLGDTCGNRGAATGPGGQTVGPSRGAWTQADYVKANADAERVTAAPGGKIGSAVPVPENITAPAEEKPTSKNSSPLGPLAIPLGLGLVGYGVYLSRKEDGAPQEAVPAGSVYKPTFATDPVGVIARYAFDAKLAIERNPGPTLLAVSGIVIGGLYFGAPMLLEASSGGAAAMTPVAATAGVSPTARGAVAGSALTMEQAAAGALKAGTLIGAAKIASDGYSYATKQGSSSSEPRKTAPQYEKMTVKGALERGEQWVGSDAIQVDEGVYQNKARTRQFRMTRSDLIGHKAHHQFSHVHFETLQSNGAPVSDVIGVLIDP